MKCAAIVALAWLLALPMPANAAGDALRLKLFFKGGVAPPSSDLVPGALPPGNNGASNAGWAATTGPGQQGNPVDYGYGASAISAFVNPQFRTLNAPDVVEVISFHSPTATDYSNGITSNMAYVDLACDGGAPVRRTAMTADANGMMRYVWAVDGGLARWADGLHECRATTVPSTGVPRILQGSRASTATTQTSIYFNTNFGGSLTGIVRWVSVTGVNSGGTSTNPTAGCGITEATACATISYARDRISYVKGAVGGSTVCLAPGTHTLGNPVENFTRSAQNQYLTIDSCGYGKALVNIVRQASGEGGIRTPKQRYHDVNFVITDAGIPSGNTGTGTSNPVGWFDDVSFNGTGPFLGASQPITNDGWGGGAFFTNVSVFNMARANGGSLMRDSTIDTLGSDALTGSNIVMNVSVSFVDRRTFATANTLAGVAQMTNVSNYARLNVGGTVGNMCGWSQVFTTKITALDPTAKTLDMAAACPNTATAINIGTGAHSDIVQFPGNKTNVIYYGLNAASLNSAQGFFQEEASTITNVAVVDSHWKSNDPSSESWSVFKSGGDLVNALFLRSTWAGGVAYDAAKFSADTWSVIDNTCTSAFPPVAGVTRRGSTGC